MDRLRDKGFPLDGLAIWREQGLEAGWQVDRALPPGSPHWVALSLSQIASKRMRELLATSTHVSDLLVNSLPTGFLRIS